MRITCFLSSCILMACVTVTAAAQGVGRNAPNVGVSIGHRAADSLLFSSASVGLFANVDTLRGVQAGLLTSVARREMRGLNVGLLAAMSHGRAYGVQASLAVNSAGNGMRGLQLSMISNVARQVNGVQIAGLTNACTTPLRGVQAGLITNIATGVRRGVQIAAGANVCAAYMRGVQVAAYNYADTLNGSQIGIVNVCVSHPRGVQVGIINYSRDTVAHKVGLVNVNPATRIDLMLYGGSSTKGNVAIRFRNRSTYSVIGFGTHYMGLDERFSGALFYRVGQYFRIAPRLTVSGDVGFYHVETFEPDSGDKPERLYSLQARLNIDWQINRTIGAFVTAGYGDTRYYHHSRRYRDRAIVETGLSLRYGRR